MIELSNLLNKDLRIDLKLLNKLKNNVKFNFEKIDLTELENIPFLKEDIEFRIKNGLLFQPGRIVETLIIQIIAEGLNCPYKGNGLYENDLFIIKQDGGSGKSDLIIFDKYLDKEFIFEIKEPVAYGKSCGFTYDDNGKPVEFTSKDENYKNYVKSLFEEGSLLEDYNILENIGHNVVFNVDDVITNFFDYIISYDNNGKLLFMTKEEYKNNFNFKIEVRSCGRNTRKVFTKNKLEIKDNIVILDKDNLHEITQRGGANSKRYKYIKNKATFSFKKSDLKIENDLYYIEFDKINQHVGEISIQHFKKK